MEDAAENFDYEKFARWPRSSDTPRLLHPRPRITAGFSKTREFTITLCCTGINCRWLSSLSQSTCTTAVFNRWLHCSHAAVAVIEHRTTQLSEWIRLRVLVSYFSSKPLFPRLTVTGGNWPQCFSDLLLLALPKREGRLSVFLCPPAGRWACWERESSFILNSKVIECSEFSICQWGYKYPFIFFFILLIENCGWPATSISDTRD